MNTTHLTLTLPAPFNFDAVVTSSGWMQLLPTTYNQESRCLGRVERLSSGQVVVLSITIAPAGPTPLIAVHVSHAAHLPAPDQDEIVARVGHMLRLDEDFTEFYALCRERGERWAPLTGGLGRMLRSSSMFEDVVKTICTTNTFWGATKGMVKRLVSIYGEPCPGKPESQAFPTPQAIAATDLETFAAAARMGYRSEYVHTLAQRVASGELDVEALFDVDLPTPVLKKKLLAIKGVGNYAAATLLTILGRYDELAVDSVFRSFVSQQYFGGQPVSDKDAQAIYAQWGKWKYLAWWYDIWQSAPMRKPPKEKKQ
jgi:3-methyladenine DNA glycosylase/8-oxoguanine DNA glycosylase